ncbi:MAG: sugar ABC transporter ATP-binding protein [Phycisphaerae bacterium]|nr:sugar ABC transporter ATP-binding protein [Phycisphaerae bacterium]
MTPAPAQRSDFLRVEGVSKRFGITQALAGVTASFDAGEVHALMGENGAGKSTLGKVIAGLHGQDEGRVVLAGRDLAPGSLRSAFDAGVRIVHQELAQCPNLSVAENLCLHDLPTTRLRMVDRREMRRRATELVHPLEPSIDPDAALGSLSPGHRQIVQIAAALDPRPPTGHAHAHAARVIVFDEPTSSLSAAETDRLLGIVRDLASRGITVLYVSHRMAEIFACCDRVTVLRDGRLVATSRIADIDEPTLVEQMIGRRIEATARRASTIALGAMPALSVRGLSSPGRLESLSLDVLAGEIVGLGGLVGAGRSEALDAIFGLDPRATGEVLVGGRCVRMDDPRAAIAAGVGYVPEDRRLQGLFFQLGVGENIVVPIMPILARLGVRRLGAERSLIADRIRDFQIKAASTSVSPGALSGGNQQKLLLARWMGRGAKVLLLDEPTRGIDVGTKAEVHRLVREAADRGAAVLLVSSEMPELLALSDRVLVLAEGRLAGELRGDEMTQANVLRLSTRTARPQEQPAA